MKQSHFYVLPLAILLLSLPVLAEGPGHGMGMGRGHGMGSGQGMGMGGPEMMGPPEHMLKELNLSAEQKDKLAKIHEGQKEKRKAQMEKMQAAHEKMRTAFQGNASEDELRKLHKEVQSLQQAMSEERFEQMLKLHQILTPEQRTKLHMMRPERMGPRGN